MRRRVPDAAGEIPTADDDAKQLAMPHRERVDARQLCLPLAGVAPIPRKRRQATRRLVLRDPEAK